MNGIERKPQAVAEKVKRPMKSFEADPDVERMIDRATQGGVKFVFLANEALRRYLREKGFARKKDQAA